MKGKFFAVGVGCGDPELLTLKAVRVLRQCDIICLPVKKEGEEVFAYEIVKKALPEISKKQKLNVLMPMIKDEKELEKIHTKGAKNIEKLLLEGKNVAFITIGDVCIYSTAIYIYTKIKNDGFDCEIVSGIPSFCSTAAQLGISLCEMKEKLHIIPSYSTNANEVIKNNDGNFVFMKSSKQINSVVENIHNNEDVNTAFLAENVTLESQRLFDIKKQKVEDTGYFSLIIAKKSEDK